MLKKRTIERTMFYGASAEIFKRANELRLNMTECEMKLWNLLKDNQVDNIRFKAQHPIDKFIADFYCHRYKLVIEIDGNIHQGIQQNERDIGRTYELKNYGITVIRFTNQEICEQVEDVIGKIREVIQEIKISTNP